MVNGRYVRHCGRLICSLHLLNAVGPCARLRGDDLASASELSATDLGDYLVDRDDSGAAVDCCMNNLRCDDPE